MLPFLKGNLSGLLLSLAIAGIAFGLSRFLPVVGGPVFGIALGILIATFIKLPAATARGIKFTSKYVLQLAVVLLGFEMNLATIWRVGQQSFVLILLTLTVALTTAYLAGRAFRVGGKLTTLIGVGTAICGGSAIAAASSAIEADDQEISYAISTIFLFNVAAVFLFPLLGHLLRLSDTGFGLWAGTAINDTSSVVAAGYSFSNAAGSFATVVKLTRSLMILPITLGLAVLHARGGRRANNFNLLRVFPWFVLGFLAAAVLSSSGLLAVESAAGLAATGKFLIIAAMAAIGFNTNLKKFIQTGPRPLLLGGFTWLVLMLVSLAIQFFAQTW